jgi:hypothetical protein
MKIIEDIYWMIPYRAKDVYYAIRDFFLPRQKWLTKKIGNGWCDKVEILRIVAFESIVHFIEQEKAFDCIEWSATPQHAEAAEAFKRSYQYVKIKIPLLENKYKKLWEEKDLCEYLNNGILARIEGEDENNKCRGYAIKKPPTEVEKILVQIREIEAEIERLTQEVIEIVAKYRNFMWT